MNVEISLVQVQEQPVAAVRKRMKPVEVGRYFQPLLDQVWEVIRGGKLAEHGHNVFVFRHDGDGEECNVDVGVQVKERFADLENVICTSTPQGRVARGVHYGDYGALPRVHLAVAEWCAENALQRDGLTWEVYGDFEADPTKRRTDVFHLLAD